MPNDPELINKAFVRAVNILNIASLERMATEENNESAKLTFIRVYNALFAVTGGDRQAMRHWLVTDNTALGMAPLELILRPDNVDKIEALLAQFLQAHQRYP